VEKEFPEKVPIKNMKTSQGAVPCEAGILAGICATESDADRAPRIVKETFSGLRGGGIIPSLGSSKASVAERLDMSMPIPIGLAKLVGKLTRSCCGETYPAGSVGCHIETELLICSRGGGETFERKDERV
jgi:hypothetical protein